MKNRILIVDDEELNRDILTDTLEDEYSLMTAANGVEALEIIRDKTNHIGLVLLDLMMPEMDGFEVIEVMQEEGIIDTVPVIVITGDATNESAVKCFEYGASDFIRKPFNETLVRHRVANIFGLYTYKNGLEKTVKAQTKELRKQNKMLEKQAAILKQNNERIIDILAVVVEHRDLESGEHVQRVKKYTKIMAEQVMKDYPEYGMTDETCYLMEQASALHDVGKIAIPDAILLKPGKFTAEEYETMKTHTIKGAELLAKVEGAWNEEYARYCTEICRWHHERYDGHGYPDALAGDEIPLSAQIVALVDVYDALVHERRYKDAITTDEAFRMIMDGECGIFSPKILDSFKRAKSRFEKMHI